MTVFEKIDLRTLGEAQPVDVDYPIADIQQGSLLLLNQRPKGYGWECHGVAERIIVIDGEVSIVTDGEEELTAYQGEMIVIPAGLRHAYHPDSNGVVAVVFGGTANNQESTKCV